MWMGHLPSTRTVEWPPQRPLDQSLSLAETMTNPTPFTVEVPQELLDDLHRRLDAVRWPDRIPGEEWAFGTSPDYLKSLVAYWRDGYDWRAQETALNRLRQFTVPLHGIDLHYIHEPGVGPHPMPLLISHGWPGSIVEFQRIIPMLTDPGSHGADPSDAFTVIAPSLPGYGFSYRPNQLRFGAEQMADALNDLMKDVLGFDNYGAQGGDWGAFITSRLGYRYPQNLVGIHVNLLAVARDFTRDDARTDEERQFADELKHFLTEETGYQWIMGTKPQTLAFALSDSPVGLAAWIIEKFRAWSDCDGDLDTYFSRDDLLTNIMLYWVTGAINSSSWPYYARRHSSEWVLPMGKQITAPMGYADFPKEILNPPRSLAERMYADIRRWTPMRRGGHFAALEEPEALAQDMREFFRPLR